MIIPSMDQSKLDDSGFKNGLSLPLEANSQPNANLELVAKETMSEITIQDSLGKSLEGKKVSEKNSKKRKTPSPLDLPIQDFSKEKKVKKRVVGLNNINKTIIDIKRTNEALFYQNLLQNLHQEMVKLSTKKQLKEIDAVQIAQVKEALILLTGFNQIDQEVKNFLIEDITKTFSDESKDIDYNIKRILKRINFYKLEQCV